MRTPKRITQVLVALVVCGAGLVTVSGNAASAAVVSMDLCALPGTATLTGTTTAPIWGFGIPSTAGDCTTATARLPGPPLTVTVGDVVSIHVINALPAGHIVTFEIPGIAFDPGPTDAAPGAGVTRTFTAGAPGTYLYQSAGDAGRQAAMGLAGALVVNPTTANQAYNSDTTAYDVQTTLVLGAVDPAFNAAPETFDMHGYKATYWLINGKAYPDTAGIGATAGQRLLLRYLNAGYDNTTMALLGLHERVLARDANLLNNPFDADAETIPAGGTEDTLVTMPVTPVPPSTNGFPLYNRQLHLTNGAQTGTSPAPATGGGMLTFIHP
jgi:FtsP/CotA-like multicopper oxidase with cupredoxin domain